MEAGATPRHDLSPREPENDVVPTGHEPTGCLRRHAAVAWQTREATISADMTLSPPSAGDFTCDRGGLVVASAHSARSQHKRSPGQALWDPHLMQWWLTHEAVSLIFHRAFPLRGVSKHAATVTCELAW